MGFSRFVELKSVRFVERLRKNKKDFIRDIVDEKDLYLLGRYLLATKGLNSLFSLSLYYDASLKTLLQKKPFWEKIMKLGK